MKMDELTERIIGCAYRVHNDLETGFLEKVYENALKIELEEAGLDVEQQCPVNVQYRGRIVGEFYADLLVRRQLVLELKAVRKLAKEHEVQLANYLNATGIENGLLINFGPSVEVKRKFKDFDQKNELDDTKNTD
jgi:GxxExxY protein